MSGALVFVILAAAAATTIGWIYRRQVKETHTRRWGEQLRRDIEQAGGVRAWKRQRTRQGPPTTAPEHRAIAFTKHPLAGRLHTSFGTWTVSVVKDEDDGRTRKFTLRLRPPDTEPEEAVTFVVRVPRTVIDHERRDSWPKDLRDELAYWISTDTIERGEMIWWPTQPE